MLVTDHEITLLLLKQKNQSISMQYWTLHGTAYKLMKAINEDISVNCLESSFWNRFITILIGYMRQEIH